MLEFNLCHSFFTEEAPKVWRAFSFDSQSRKAGDPAKLNPCLLSTAGVYLYLLGRSWQDGDEFDPTKFGEMYREPAQFLKDNKPNEGFISWILDRAFDDKNTQARMQRRRIAPVLY